MTYFSRHISCTVHNFFYNGSLLCLPKQELIPLIQTLLCDFQLMLGSSVKYVFFPIRSSRYKACFFKTEMKNKNNEADCKWIIIMNKECFSLDTEFIMIMMWIHSCRSSLLTQCLLYNPNKPWLFRGRVGFSINVVQNIWQNLCTLSLCYPLCHVCNTHEHIIWRRLHQHPL